MSETIRLISNLLGKEDVLSSGKPVLQQRGEENVTVTPVKLSDLEFDRDGKTVKAKDFFVLLSDLASLQAEVKAKNASVEDFMSKLMSYLKAPNGVNNFKTYYGAIQYLPDFNTLKDRRDFSDFFNQYGLAGILKELEQFSDIVGKDIVNNLNRKLSMDVIDKSSLNLLPFSHNYKQPFVSDTQSWDFILNKDSFSTIKKDGSHFSYNQVHIITNAPNTSNTSKDFLPYLNNLKFTKDYLNTANSPYLVSVASDEAIKTVDYTKTTNFDLTLDKSSKEILNVKNLVSSADWSSNTNKNTDFLVKVLNKNFTSTGHKEFSVVSGFKGCVGSRQPLEVLKSDKISYTQEFELDKENGYYYYSNYTFPYHSTKTFYSVPTKLTKLEVQFPFRVVHVFHNDSSLTLPKNFVLAIPDSVELPLITVEAKLVKSNKFVSKRLNSSDVLTLPIRTSDYYNYDFKQYSDLTRLASFNNSEYYQYYTLRYPHGFTLLSLKLT